MSQTTFPYKSFEITISDNNNDGVYGYTVSKDGEECVFMSETFNSFDEAKKAAKKHVTRGLVFMEGRNAKRARRRHQSRTKVTYWREDLETGAWTASFEDVQSIFEIALVPEGNRWYWSIYRDGREVQEGDYLDTLNLATILRILENKVKGMSRTYSRSRRSIRSNRRQANYTVRVIWEGELLSQQGFSDENEAYDHFDEMIDVTDRESDPSGTTVQIIQGDDVLGERHFARTAAGILESRGVISRRRRATNRRANLSEDEIRAGLAVARGLAGRCQNIAYEMGITHISFDEWFNAARETVEYFQSEGIPMGDFEQLETEILAVYNIEKNSRTSMEKVGETPVYRDIVTDQEKSLLEAEGWSSAGRVNEFVHPGNPSLSIVKVEEGWELLNGSRVEVYPGELLNCIEEAEFLMKSSMLNEPDDLQLTIKTEKTAEDFGPIASLWNGRAKAAVRRKSSKDYDSKSTEELQEILDLARDVIEAPGSSPEATDTAWETAFAIKGILESRGVVTSSRRAMRRASSNHSTGDALPKYRLKNLDYGEVIEGSAWELGEMGYWEWADYDDEGEYGHLWDALNAGDMHWANEISRNLGIRVEEIS